MQTFYNAPEFSDLYTGQPRPIRVVLCNKHSYLTFVGDCGHDDTDTMTKYGVIGTDYGKLHNSMGEWRFWNSPSSAYKAAKEYRAYRSVL